MLFSDNNAHHALKKNVGGRFYDCDEGSVWKPRATLNVVLPASAFIGPVQSLASLGVEDGHITQQDNPACHMMAYLTRLFQLTFAGPPIDTSMMSGTKLLNLRRGTYMSVRVPRPRAPRKKKKQAADKRRKAKGKGKAAKRKRGSMLDDDAEEGEEEDEEAANDGSDSEKEEEEGDGDEQANEPVRGPSTRLHTSVFFPDDIDEYIGLLDTSMARRMLGYDPAEYGVPLFELAVEPLFREYKADESMLYHLQQDRLVGVLWSIRIIGDMDIALMIRSLLAHDLAASRSRKPLETFNNSPKNVYGPAPSMLGEEQVVTTPAMFETVLRDEYYRMLGITDQDVIDRCNSYENAFFPHSTHDYSLAHLMNPETLSVALEQLGVCDEQTYGRVVGNYDDGIYTRPFLPIPSLHFVQEFEDLVTGFESEFPFYTNMTMFRAVTDHEATMRQLRDPKRVRSILTASRKFNDPKMLVSEHKIPASLCQRIRKDAEIFGKELEQLQTEVSRMRVELYIRNNTDVREQLAVKEDLLASARRRAIVTHAANCTSPDNASEATVAVMHFYHERRKTGKPMVVAQHPLAPLLCQNREVCSQPRQVVVPEIGRTVTATPVCTCYNGLTPTGNFVAQRLAMWKVLAIINCHRTILDLLEGVYMSGYTQLGAPSQLLNYGDSDSSKSYAMKNVYNACIAGTISQLTNTSRKAYEYENPLNDDTTVMTHEMPDSVIGKETDNTDAAKAMTSMFSEGFIFYKTVVKDPVTGRMRTVNAPRLAYATQEFASNLDLKNAAVKSRMQCINNGGGESTQAIDAVMLAMTNDSPMSPEFERVRTVVQLKQLYNLHARNAIEMKLIRAPQMELLQIMTPTALRIMQYLGVSQVEGLRKIKFMGKRYSILTIEYAIHMHYFSFMSEFIKPAIRDGDNLIPVDSWSKADTDCYIVERAPTPEDVLGIEKYLGANMELFIFVLSRLISDLSPENDRVLLEGLILVYANISRPKLMCYIRYLRYIRKFLDKDCVDIVPENLRDVPETLRVFTYADSFRDVCEVEGEHFLNTTDMMNPERAALDSTALPMPIGFDGSEQDAVSPLSGDPKCVPIPPYHRLYKIPEDVAMHLGVNTPISKKDFHERDVRRPDEVDGDTGVPKKSGRNTFHFYKHESGRFDLNYVDLGLQIDKLKATTIEEMLHRSRLKIKTSVARISENIQRWMRSSLRVPILSDAVTHPPFNMLELADMLTPTTTDMAYKSIARKSPNGTLCILTHCLFMNGYAIQEQVARALTHRFSRPGNYVSSVISKRVPHAYNIMKLGTRPQPFVSFNNEKGKMSSVFDDIALGSGTLRSISKIASSSDDDNYATGDREWHEDIEDTLNLQWAVEIGLRNSDGSICLDFTPSALARRAIELYSGDEYLREQDRDFFLRHPYPTTLYYAEMKRVRRDNSRLDEFCRNMYKAPETDTLTRVLSDIEAHEPPHKKQKQKQATSSDPPPSETPVPSTTSASASGVGSSKRPWQ